MSTHIFTCSPLCVSLPAFSCTKTSQPISAVIDVKDGKLLIDRIETLNRRTEYCDALYNYDLHPDNSLLQAEQYTTEGEDRPPIPEVEVEAASRNLKPGKSTRVDNVRIEVMENEDGETVNALTALCQRIWEQKWRKELGPVSGDTTTK